jgi:hypothetical protein
VLTVDSELTATNFRATFGALGLAQHHVAKLFGVSSRCIRRWERGDRRTPLGISILINLMASGVVTVGQVERAARTNGSAKPEPAPVEPTPERSAVADTGAVYRGGRWNGPPGRTPERSITVDAEVSALADPGSTTAAEVYALAPRTCRWPIGDPAQPGFHFCGAPAVERPYCERHCAVAYVAPSSTRPQQPLAGGQTPGVAWLPAASFPPRRRAPFNTKPRADHPAAQS